VSSTTSRAPPCHARFDADAARRIGVAARVREQVRDGLRKPPRVAAHGNRDDAGNTTYRFTTQLFFDDATSDVALANYPYDTRGNRDTTNRNDGIYDASMLLDLSTPDGGASYTGPILLGLELEGATLGDAIYANGFESA
jgi:hypothetical protein